LDDGLTTVMVTATVPTTSVVDPFALAQEAGLAIMSDTVAFEEDPALTTTLQYETQLIDPTRPPEPARPGCVLPAAVLARVAPFGAAGQAVFRRHGRARYRNPELVA
jgi:hypothetical protein